MDGLMDSGDRPETGLPAHLPAPLESRRRSGLLSRLAFAEGHRPDSRRVSLGISAAIVVVGLSVLVGWASGLDLLTSWNPGHVQTKVNAALCLVLLGLAVGVSVGWTSHRRIWLARGLACLALALAGATLLEHLAGVDLGVDQVLHADPVSASSPHPGRFAVQTAVAF